MEYLWKLHIGDVDYHFVVGLYLDFFQDFGINFCHSLCKY